MLELLIFLLKSTEIYLPSPVNNNNKNLVLMELCMGKVNEKISKYRPCYQMASFIVSLYNIASKD